MVAAAEAVKVIARVVNLPEDVVDRYARRLKEARRDLWPLSRRGGGRFSAHVQPKHVTNLVLALAVTAESSPADAPDAVERFRAFKIRNVTFIAKDGSEPQGKPPEVLEGNLPTPRKFDNLQVAATLGDTLDALLADGVPKGGMLSVELRLNHVEEAVISLHDIPDTVQVRFQPIPFPPRPQRSTSASLIMRQATLWGPTLKGLYLQCFGENNNSQLNTETGLAETVADNPCTSVTTPDTTKADRAPPLPASVCSSPLGASITQNNTQTSQDDRVSSFPHQEKRGSTGRLSRKGKPA